MTATGKDATGKYIASVGGRRLRFLDETENQPSRMAARSLSVYDDIPPLDLSPNDKFWSAAEQPTAWEKA